MIMSALSTTTWNRELPVSNRKRRETRQRLIKWLYAITVIVSLEHHMLSMTTWNRER